MREKIRKFMTGRYGIDQFNRFLLGLALVSMIISIFAARVILYSAAVLFLGFCYYRMLSKNFEQRYRENNRYLDFQNQFLSVFHKGKNTLQQRKVYHIYKCPACKQKIRIPRGKGRISITCPKCRTEFVKNS